MIRFALASAPQQAAYLDTYGWLLYKKGALADARKWLVRARGARRTPDPVILDHLGDTLWRLGQSTQAVEQWEAAIEAVAERMNDDQPASTDERRVQRATPEKIKDARAEREPSVAPLAEPSDREGETAKPDVAEPESKP